MRALQIISLVLAYYLIPSPLIAQDTEALIGLDQLKPHLEMTKPEGNGPFPAVVFAAGCRGFEYQPERQNSAQQRLTQMGYVVVRADYHKARNEPHCQRVEAITFKQAANDVSVVADYMKSLSFIDPEDITLVGWSFGGGAVLHALSYAPDSVANRVIAYYPSCWSLEPWNGTVPSLVLFGEADGVVSLPHCQYVLKDSALVTFKTFPDVGHGFDNGTSPESLAAWEEIEAFLKR